MSPQELRPWAKWLVLISGHLGALGRGALFMGVSILMFRALGGEGDANKKENTVSKALNQLVVRTCPCIHWPWRTLHEHVLTHPASLH